MTSGQPLRQGRQSFLLCIPPTVIALLIGGCTGTAGDIAPNLAGEAAWVNGPAGRVAVREVGPEGGLTLVMVHDWSDDMSAWAWVAGRLSETHRVVTLDLRGHGLSDVPSEDVYQVEACAGDVTEVIRQRGLERVVLVGHGWGASVALAAALRASESVAGLVMIDPMSDLSGTPVANQRAFLEAILMAQKPADEIRALQTVLLGGSSEVVRARIMNRPVPSASLVAGVFSGLFSYQAVAELDRVRKPILAVVASNNAGATSLPAQSENVPWKTITGTGHWIMIEKPDTTVDVINEFLAFVR